jgi:hypothetical protein
MRALALHLGWLLPLSSALVFFAACGGSQTTAGAPFDAGASSSSGSSGGEDVATKPDTGGSSGQQSSGGTTVGKLSFVVNKIYLGESDRAGVKNKDAWKVFGRDIDGLATVITTSTSPDLMKVCKRKAGAPATVHNDGTAGIDNAWGKEILKLMDPFAPTPSKQMTDAIVGGSRTGMFSLDGKAGSFVYAEEVSAPPTFASNEQRPVAAEWLSGGNPKATFVNGGVLSNGIYDSGDIAGELLLGIAPDVVVPLRKARITMKIAGDEGSVTEGTISGVVETEVLVNAFAASMGRLSPELCSGTTVEGIKDSMRQASDILKDGTQDPNVECDGISVGIGFDATRVVVGPVAPAPQPSPDPCQ